MSQKFLHQLRLLLWKNFLIKRRSLFIVMFELTVPLVLFLIMFAIRAKQTARPIETVYFNAWPLPSAGFVPLMQSFCHPESGVKNENGFYEYPNSTANQMLIQIEKILKSNWSSTWFQNNTSSFISPTFQKPMSNLNKLTDNLMAAYFLKTHPDSRQSNQSSSEISLSSVFAKHNEKLADLFLNQIKLPKSLYDKLTHNLSIDRDELYKLYYEEKSVNGSFDKPERVKLLRSLFCNRTIFDRVIRLNGSSDEEKTQMQRELCGMSDEQLSQFDDMLITDDSLFNNHDTSLRLGLLDYLNFLNALDDLALLSTHFPTGLCKSKNAADILKESNEKMKNNRPESLINENTLSPNGDANLKKKLKKNYGFIGLWYSMQKTFCGSNSVKSNKATTGQKVSIMTNGTNSTQDDAGSETDVDENDDLLSKDQLRSLSLLFHVMYSNPIILYSPNTTTIRDNIIRKTNGTFEMIDKINIFCRQWLETSVKLVEYIKHDSTNQSLTTINSIKELSMNRSASDSQSSTTSTTTTTTTPLRDQDKSQVQDLLDQLPDKTIQSDLIERIDMIDSAACSWLSLMSGVNLNLFKGFASEQDLVKYFLNEAYSNNETVIASVVFDSKNTTNQQEEPERLDKHIVYKIRQNASFTYTTRKIRERYWYPSPRDWDYYYYLFGFVWLQDLIDRAIIDYHSNSTVLEPGNYLHQMPYPCYMIDNFLQMIQHVMPLCLSVSFVYTVAMLTQTMVYEKEMRLKEVMKIMGMSNMVHLLAWFITYFVQFSVIMLIITCILHFGKILSHSNPILVFLLLEIYAIATICFSFLVSSLYSKAKLAAACAGILYFLSYVPCMFISIREDVAYQIIPWWAKTMACLLSTSAFGIGSKYIAFYENDGQGIQWSNIRESPLENDTYNCFNAMCIMIIDCVIYLLLACYIENVNPSYGIPLPWNYPFKMSYWMSSNGVSENDVIQHTESSWFHNLLVKLRFKKSSLSFAEPNQARLLQDRWNQSFLIDEPDESGESVADASRQAPTTSSPKKVSSPSKNKNLFEREPHNLKIGVSIKNLTKRYGDSKLAVDNLSINFYENQITSFLGHNGAGKTTTMSILTGLIPPTSGYALIYGKDIRTDINSVRKNLGWCPQHNILFDKLTVEEHLWFYAKLKHMNESSIKELIDNMLQDIGLSKKRNNLVNQLSGGMQRKLSVAISFVGDAGLIILDEPTAGVDPHARRAIWDLLLKYKMNRTILLSTHHMDEAELLGDRIAIISDGRLQCTGTSLFLKNALGEGNNLTVVKNLERIESNMQLYEQEFRVNPDNFLKLVNCKSKLVSVQELGNNPELVRSLIGKKFASELVEFIKIYSPRVTLKEESLREYQFLIPLSERSNQTYWNLFKALEEAKDKLRIDSYGIHDVSLEEIFIKAVQLDEIHAEENSSDSKSTESPSKTKSPKEDDNESLLSFSSDSGQEDSAESLNEHKSLYNLDYIFDDLDTGSSLYFTQFKTILLKRYLYNRRNWKSVLTQIILPACFICIAMTVALSAPGFEDLPALELSTAQFYPLTKPEGTYLPYSYNIQPNRTTTITNTTDVRSATTRDIVDTLTYLIGLGGTCTLNCDNLTSILDVLSLNQSNGKLFRSELFGHTKSCQMVLDQTADLRLDYFNITSSSSKTPGFKSYFGKVGKNYYPDCDCLSDYSGFVCNSDYQLPPKFRALTHETLLNISGENETKYYLYTTDMYRLKRYGGLSFDNEYFKSSSKNTDASKTEVVDEFSELKSNELLQNLIKHRIGRIWYNNKAFHGMPTFVSVMNNAILRANVKNTLASKMSHDQALFKANEYGITVINHPMNQTNNYVSTEYLLQGSDVLISIFTIVAMSFVNASFVLFLVYERSIKSLHLQFLMGLNPLLYWITNIIWDLFNYMLPASCVIIIFKIFDVPAYVSGSNYPAVILLFLFYGWSVSPLMYPLTFVFKEPSTAYIFLIVCNLFTGITCVESSFLLQVFSMDKDLDYILNFLKTVFLIFPPYCLGRGLIDIAYNDYYNTFYTKTGQLSKIRSPFEWDITTRNLVAMASVGLISWICTLLLEYDFFKFKWVKSGLRSIFYGRTETPRDSYANVNKYASKNEDPDVQSERLRVEKEYKLVQNSSLSFSTNHSNQPKDQIILRGLRKVYKKTKLSSSICWFSKKSSEGTSGSDGFVAVKNLSLGVPEGECFGLLGVNGAGKTTTFKMLTTDLEPSEGEIYVKTRNNTFVNALNNKTQYWNQIGYCPQFDALYDELTPTEHLRLFARLKGVKSKHENHLIECLLKRLDLVRYCNKPAGELSLGNKRKLSTAVALVGNPSIILLDEPTSGQDPVSRRRLWEEIINLTKTKGHSVLLTSHSMEEIQALCTRLAIMVSGRFKCMGSVQHLKAKFGEGYTLTVKIRDRFSSSSSQRSVGHRRNVSSTSSISHDEALEQQSIRNMYIQPILAELKLKISSKCKLKERNFNNVYQFELPCPGPNDSFNIGDIYKLIELNKLRFSIVDYSLSQNTLDNVFINFVKEQTNKKLQKDENSQNNGGNSSGDSEDEDDVHENVEENRYNNSGIQFPIHDETDDLLLSLETETSLFGANNKNSSSSSSSNSPSTSRSYNIDDNNTSDISFRLFNQIDNNYPNDRSNPNLRLESIEMIADDYC